MKNKREVISINLSTVFYQKIVDEIIEPGLNKFDARNKLAEIIENYKIIKQENDFERYDIQINIEKYLRDKKRQGLSPVTIYSYGLILRKFANFMKGKKLQEITRKIYCYFDYREADENVKEVSTLETTRSILRSFFDWLKEEQIITENLMIKIKPFKMKQYIVKALTIEELETVRDACSTLRQKALVEMFYSTGCRLDEIVKININDIDWQNRSIKVIGKGDKQRIVFFSVRASIILKKYLESRNDDCPALFITERKPYRRLGRRQIQKEIVKIKNKAEFTKDLSPHVFRHTMATLMLNKGCPMSVVQELLGHEHMSTTETYAKVTQDYKHQSYEKYFYQ